MWWLQSLSPLQDGSLFLWLCVPAGLPGAQASLAQPQVGESLRRGAVEGPPAAPPPSLMFLGISIPSSLPVFWSRSFQLGHTLFPAEASATHRWKTLCPWRGHVGGVLFVFLQETSEMVSCVGDSLVRKLCVGVPMWGTHACVWRPPQLFETVPLTELGTISFSQTGYPASPRVLLPWSCWG